MLGNIFAEDGIAKGYYRTMISAFTKNPTTSVSLPTRQTLRIKGINFAVMSHEKINQFERKFIFNSQNLVFRMLQTSFASYLEATDFQSHLVSLPQPLSHLCEDDVGRPDDRISLTFSVRQTRIAPSWNLWLVVSQSLRLTWCLCLVWILDRRTRVY